MKNHVSGIVVVAKKRWKIIGLALILLITAGFYFVNVKANGTPTQTFIKPERKDIVQTLEVSGVVDAKEKARLRFIAGGKATFIGAQTGDWVKKWQTLATVDAASLQKQLQQDLNFYMKERLDWEETRDYNKDRALDTTETRLVAKEQYDLTNEVLDVEIRDIAIQNTRLTAPFAGVLTTSPATVPGVTLLSTDYFEVVNPETLIFRAAVDEIDISKVSLQQASSIRFDAYDEVAVESTVSYISYTSNESSSGTVFLIELPIPNPDLSKYRIGMNGDVAITLAKKENALVIPLIAIRERDDKAFVDVKVNEKEVAEREITLGIEANDDVEILSGLTETDEVLLPEQ